jgi:peptidoglycan hydrolase-like protein with peptidoglycan-binding domain
MKTRLLLIPLTVALLSAMPVRAQTPAPADAPAGAKGVRQAQEALRAQGHDPGRIDGVMGPQTSAALKAYQKQHGLTTTGRLDDATLAKLGQSENAAAGESRPAPSSPPTGGDTRPSKVDPAQSHQTGSNAGEGASYSRSTEKGQSAEKTGPRKK